MVVQYLCIQNALYTLFALLVIFWSWYQWKNRKTIHFANKLPTVKRTLPFIGHLMQCKFKHVFDLREMLSFFLLDFSFLASQKNINQYCIWAGPKPYITVTNPEDIKVILTRHLQRGEEFDLIKFVLGNGLITGPVKVWKPLRKAMTPMFHPRNLEHMVLIFNSNSRMLVKQLSAFVGKPDCDVQSNTTKTSISSALDFIYGPEIKLFDRTVIEKNTYKAIVSSFNLWFERCASVLSRWDVLFQIIYRKSLNDVRENTSFIMHHAKEVLPKKIADYEANKSLKNIPDLGGRVVMSDVFAHLMATNKSITFEDFYSTVCTMVSTGSQTTASTLSTCFLMLAIHQDIQDKVYEEIISSVGNSNEDVDLIGLKKLTYTDQVIKETLRIVPPISVYSRFLTEDTQLSFGMAPAGSQISVNVYGVHMDPKNYPDPIKFDPDRFSPDNVKKRHKFSFLTFGGGPRNCIGKDFTNMAMKITLVHALREYKFTTTTQMKDIKFLFNIELKYKNGCRVAISKRL